MTFSFSRPTNTRKISIKAPSIFASFVLSLCALMSTQTALASDVTAANKSAITSQFSKIGVTVSEVASTPINGLVEVVTDQGLFYSTPTADFFLQGKLYSLDKNGQFADVTAVRNAKQAEKFADEMIVYKAKNEKHVITVFTDITCGYCVKLHKEMQDYNDKGITVRYMAYPRQGPRGDVATAMAKVWCADDKKSALDAVKLHNSFEFDSKNLAQCQNEIAKQYAFGSQLGINGTPAILLSSGQLVGGYVPADKLLPNLEAI